jgi:FemAB-related protein (PEP-CTERM system-associated)
VIEAAYGWPCYYLGAWLGAELKGVVPLVLMRSPMRRPRLVSLPYLDQGGILATATDCEAELLGATQRLARELGAREVELRGWQPELLATGGSEEDAGADPPRQRYRLVLDLPDSPENLWKKLPAKVRNQVRKAEKEGLETQSGGARAVEDFYGVFLRNMRDLGSPVHSRGFFAAIWSELGDRTRVYVTRDRQGTAVAGGVAIRFRGSVTVPWASSLRSRRASCPNHSLYWAILADATSEGARSFDFGRSWAASGTFDFKRHWGAEPVSLPWSSLDAQGRWSKSGSLRAADHRTLTMAWQKLPLALVSWLGPRVRRYLAN